MAEIIRTAALTKIYPSAMGGLTALDGIDLTVEKGEFVGIFGVSGSGKTTLLNILSGMDNATKGTAYIDGRDVTKMDNDEVISYRRQKIGFIFQDFRLIESLNIKENIALPLVLDKKPAKETDEIVEGMMDFFGIDRLAGKTVSSISNAQKQRVSAARALVVNPVVCLADEPTGNLDSEASTNVMEMLTLMNVDSGTTILLATHDVVSASYCKRVIFIDDGRIVLDISRGGGRQEFLGMLLDNMQARAMTESSPPETTNEPTDETDNIDETAPEEELPNGFTQLELPENEFPPHDAEEHEA